MFFCLAVDSSLESAERASHAVDLAYLYYLPFSMIFVSEDKLHARIVPYFLTGGQAFVRGSELKNDLKKLDDYFWSLPEEVKRRGMFSLASHPPLEGDFLVCRLWDQFWPGWREDAAQREAKKSDLPRRDERLNKFLDEIDKAKAIKPPPVDKVADPEFMQIVRNIPVRRGRWPQFPPEVEAANEKGAKQMAVTQMISETNG